MTMSSHQHSANSLDIHRVLRFLQRLLDCFPSSLNHLGVKGRHYSLPVADFRRISDFHESVNIVFDIRDRMLISLASV